MKILVVSPKFHPVIGGGETYVLNSVARLHDAGLDVSVAVEPNETRRLADYPYKVYEVNGLSDSNLNVIDAVAGLHKLIARLQPNIIHAHGYFALLAVGLSNAWDIPVIASIHSTPVWNERLIGGMDSFTAELNFVRQTLDLAQPQLITAANKVYADAAKAVVEQQIKVTIMPYPVDIEFFRNSDRIARRRELGLAESACLILTPSRIIERKGIKEAVFALDKLPASFYLCLPAAVKPLDLVYWESICADPVYAKVKDRIIIPKRAILYDDMPSLYAAADIVAMPSYYEGAPVATVEAMASGKPFIGADSQGINSFIRTGVNGVLVPKKSVTELAKAIYHVSQDCVLQDRLTTQARKDIDYLSWDAQLHRLIVTYDGIVNDKKRVPALTVRVSSQ